MTLLEAVTIVVAAQGYRGLGFKSAAALAGIPKSAMRYALKAWSVGLTQAVLYGVIGDQRVVGILSALPTDAARAIARTEVKLRRHLSRERAAKLAELYLKYSAKRYLMPQVQIERRTSC